MVAEDGVQIIPHFSRSPCLPCCCGGAFIVTRGRYQWLLQDDTPGDALNEAYTTRETHGFHVEWLPSRCREGARERQTATLGEPWWNLCEGSLIPFGFERETTLHKVQRGLRRRRLEKKGAKTLMNTEIALDSEMPPPLDFHDRTDIYMPSGTTCNAFRASSPLHPSKTPAPSSPFSSPPAC
ncbi:hypothetical protein FA13DRAFT_933603 [Coprinellus micaceus]|uniref:Uncharacterized protein n=1 Tax=Coprinellus micaceus TaxID=71717 RepID=A0A4Y7SZU9_COPMI|nr:hypothetical protein FA13DRAFT_933603 [Coprinellus micaceus]